MTTAQSALIQGDALTMLAQMEPESAHTVITSPPYWGLRQYLPDGHPLGAQEIGQEETISLYLERLVAVFAQVYRVLRPDGTLWLNMGDSYAAPGYGLQKEDTRTNQGLKTTPQALRGSYQYARQANREGNQGLGRKQLIGLPWKLAFALQEWGWILRADNIYHKLNPLPESVKDRPTRAHEYVFLFAKARHYYYDAVAVNEPSPLTNLRNLRSVWPLATQPFRGQHFAVFPEALVERCVLAGTAPKACPTCFAPWRRVEVEGNLHPETIAWRSSCQCSDNDGSGRCTVLDPFVGSGTTLRVAYRLGRHGVGIDLNPHYGDMQESRLRDIQMSLEGVR